MSSGKVEPRWIAVIAVTLALILVVNPVGFVGGGMDDWQYLNAARCWAEYGPCLPHDHWQGRWPIVAPLGATIALFGESRLTVGLPSLAYSAGCLGLLAMLGNRVAGRPVGYLSALLLLVTPVFAIGMLDPSVEAAELFFLLGGAWCVVAFTADRSPWWAFAAGLSLSMAFQVRETSIAAAPLALLALWLFARHDARAWLFAAVGAAVPLIAEAIIFWLATGDPLWRRELSMAHTQIASTELDGPIDHNRSPLLNPNYIAHWKREPGIHVHWLIDGLLNLLCNAKAGFTLSLSALLFAIYGRTLDRRRQSIVAWCLGIALYWACFLIYILAIDPKPRMMLVPISLSAIALPILAIDRAEKGSRLLAWVTISASVFLSLLVTLTAPSMRAGEAAFAQWQRQFPGQIEADETMRRHFALVPGGGSLPDIGSGRPLLILRLEMRCSVWAREAARGSLTAVDRARLSTYDPEASRNPGNVCLFRYEQPMSPAAISQAIASGETVASNRR